MDDIRRLLKLAATRLEMTSFLSQLHTVATIIIGAVLIPLLLIDKAPAEEFLPWMWIVSAAVSLTLIVATILWSRARRSELQVAMAVDERLGLKEKLSTALHCQGRDDVFAMAALEDAVKTARNPKAREMVGRHFKIDPPRKWWLGPLLVMFSLLIWFIPAQDLFAEDNKEESVVIEQARLDAQNSIDELVKSIKEKPQLSKELADLIGELTKDGIDPDAMKSSRDIKRDAIKKVTDLNKKLDDLLNGEKSKSADALDKTLQQLRTPKDGSAKELAEAIANGNFKAALKALEELKTKMKNGELNQKQKDELEQQLNDMAEQLKQLAQQQQQLEDALKKAGLDPQLAQNPQALQQAIQNNPNLNQQQKKQLQQMAQAQQAANSMCQGMGSAMQQMAQGMQNGKFGQGAQQMGQQLSQMEALKQMLQQARAAQSMCQGQCNKMGQGLALKPGGAFGPRGQGRGGKAPLAPTPTGFRETKANINTTEGDIIARVLFDGPQVVGESKAKIKQIAAEAAEGFDEALAEDQLPRRYHETQKHYFGELKKLTEARQLKDDETSSGGSTESSTSEESTSEESSSGDSGSDGGESGD